jgi:tetratricopeptide (TPR) repeat protein
MMTLFFCLIAVGYCQCQQFDKGNQAYFNGDFETAYSQYQSCLPAESFSLFYNLGNTAYQLEKYGESKLWYEKARLLNPAEGSLLFNLGLLERKLEDQEEPQFLSSVEFALHHWLWTSLFLLFPAGLLFLLSSRTRWQNTLMVLLLLSSSLIFFWSLSHERGTDFGVVLKEESNIYANRSTQSSAVTKVHAGKLVKILNTMDGWYMVEFAPGGKGWLPSQDLGEINS